ncbi:MAG: prolipoprotein diacylglyceryl transferase [Planctomycetes bacterium]|nr:prolipoprotein diacylglyceryl transferase [Planctomycetota bacterium]
MYPELFQIPFTQLTVKSYGLMMVIGFLSAVYLIRRLSKNITPDPQLITNAALYALIAGVVGARIFYVVHYFDRFSDNLLSVFAIWQGGLELLGGVLLAIAVIFFYLRYHKLPIRKYLDILAIALLLALAFGRIGCFLNGCCYGKPSNLPWAVRFPYGSFAYRSQVYPNHARDRTRPQLLIPLDFFGYETDNRKWVNDLKPFDKLTPQQQDQVTTGQYRALTVHPTQFYSSANALFCSWLLFVFWRRSQNAKKAGQNNSRFIKSGQTFALMFILYGTTRVILEFFRDDNPFEFDSMTVSQNIGIVLAVLGTVLMLTVEKIKWKKHETITTQ